MQPKYTYIFDREFIHSGQIQIGKAKCDVDNVDFDRLRIKAIQNFKVINKNDYPETIREGDRIHEMKKTDINEHLYLIKYRSGWWGSDDWIYVSEDELNLYMMPIKTSCLKIGKETSLEFSVQKEGLFLPKRITYNYDIFTKDNDKGESFEFEIFSILKLIFTRCEDEAITAFFPGIVDALEQYKEMYIKLNNFGKDIEKEQYKEAASSLKELLINTYKTMEEIGKKDIHILTAKEILKLKDDEEKKEKKLAEERARKHKEQASLIVDDFNQMIQSRQELLKQFNGKGGGRK